eukprot:366331-Chlamydomonas_euryale.AAC.30
MPAAAAAGHGQQLRLPALCLWRSGRAKPRSQPGIGVGAGGQAPSAAAAAAGGAAWRRAGGRSAPRLLRLIARLRAVVPRLLHVVRRLLHTVPHLARALAMLRSVPRAQQAHGLLRGRRRPLQRVPQRRWLPNSCNATPPSWGRHRRDVSACGRCAIGGAAVLGAVRAGRAAAGAADDTCLRGGTAGHPRALMCCTDGDARRPTLWRQGSHIVAVPKE